MGIWNEGNVVEITEESATVLRVMFAGVERRGEVREDDALHWDNGEVWLRCDPWSAPTEFLNDECSAEDNDKCTELTLDETCRFPSWLAQNKTRAAMLAKTNSCF